MSDEIEHEENGFRHMERWLLFQTAQFVQHMALDDVSQLGSRTHIFEILDTVTGLFEFIGRMADRGVISDRAIVSCRLLKVAGRELVWPDAPNGLSPNGWCQDDEIVIEYGYQVQDLKESRRNIAVEVAMEIYMRFGWSNPPQEELKQIQSQRFGSPLRT